MSLLSRFADDPDCACAPAFEDGALVVDAADCPGDGRLAVEPACRATVVDALTDRDADHVVTRTRGTERRYDGAAGALLVAAGRFAERVADRDDRLAARTRRDPTGAAREAAGRPDPVADAAAETGLLAASRVEDPLAPLVRPTVARASVAPDPPPGATLADTRPTDGDHQVAVYECAGDDLRRYHLEPLAWSLDDEGRRSLAAARDLLASGAVTPGERGPRRAVSRVADGDLSLLADLLRKHTRGYGVLEDLFADPGLTDVFAPAPAATEPLRVRVDGETMRTNVRLTAAGADALVSRLRAESGRPLSRAAPSLDAEVTVPGAGRVRAAAVTEPLSDGAGFALRTHDAARWTLARLVRVGTLSPHVAALLSLAVQRGAALLVGGARGAGKTTTLGALLWALPRDARLVVLEDTPELPVDGLRADGRDVQALRTDRGRGTDPAAALRTALRLGDGALAVGEVRGDEASALYEAMRVGAGDSAVLGTVHGERVDGIRERVVSDLGVPGSSFGATDLVVTLRRTADGTRRVVAVEEVLDGTDGTSAALVADGAVTGRLDRGNSEVLASLAGPDETYGDVLDAVASRASRIASRAERPADERERPEPERVDA